MIHRYVNFVIYQNCMRICGLIYAKKNHRKQTPEYKTNYQHKIEMKT